MTGGADISKGSIDVGIIFSFSLCLLLVTSYFKYETSSFFRNIADLFIGIGFGKRTKTDLLVIAIIPFVIFVMFLAFRLM